jgi:hypothetical protein
MTFCGLLVVYPMSVAAAAADNPPPKNQRARIHECPAYLLDFLDIRPARVCPMHHTVLALLLLLLTSP